MINISLWWGILILWKAACLGTEKEVNKVKAEALAQKKAEKAAAEAAKQAEAAAETTAEEAPAESAE